MVIPVMPFTAAAKFSALFPHSLLVNDAFILSKLFVQEFTTRISLGIESK